MTAVVLAPGTPSSVGGLPYRDVHVAARAALALTPDLPAAPQLPQRHPKEGMLAQVAASMPGVRAALGGAGLVVDRRRFGPGDSADPLDPVAWAATLAFLHAAAADDRHGPVKLQVAGPITLGLALRAAGVPSGEAFAVAGRVVAGRVRALVETSASVVPSAPVVLVLDEPGLTATGDPSFPLGPDETIDLLSSGLAAAGSAMQAGIHCCGPTDWRLVLQAGPDLVSMPVDERVSDDAAVLSTFLERGGWIAWGAVPTDRPLGNRGDAQWRRLTQLWCDLSRNGCDPMLLRTQAILTPACGLALHRAEQVETIFGLVRQMAERVHDQALAARMSAGA